MHTLRIITILTLWLWGELQSNDVSADTVIQYRNLEQCREKHFTTAERCQEGYDRALQDAHGDAELVARQGFIAPYSSLFHVQKSANRRQQSERTGPRLMTLTYKSLAQCLELAKAPAKRCQSAFARALNASAMARGVYRTEEACVADGSGCVEMPSIFYRPKVDQYPFYSRQISARQGCEFDWPGLACVEGRTDKNVLVYQAIFNSADMLPRYSEVTICEDDFGEGACEKANQVSKFVRAPVNFVVSAPPRLVATDMSGLDVFLMILGFLGFLLWFCFFASCESQMESRIYAPQGILPGASVTPPPLVLPGSESVAKPASASDSAVIAMAKPLESPIVKNKRRIFLND